MATIAPRSTLKGCSIGKMFPASPLPAVPPEKIDETSVLTAEPSAEPAYQLARPNLLASRGLRADGRSGGLQPAAGGNHGSQTHSSAGQRHRGVVGDRTYGIPQCRPRSRLAMG